MEWQSVSVPRQQQWQGSGMVRAAWRERGGDNPKGGGWGGGGGETGAGRWAEAMRQPSRGSTRGERGRGAAGIAASRFVPVSGRGMGHAVAHRLRMNIPPLPSASGEQVLPSPAPCIGTKNLLVKSCGSVSQPLIERGIPQPSILGQKGILHSVCPEAELTSRASQKKLEHKRPPCLGARVGRPDKAA